MKNLLLIFLFHLVDHLFLIRTTPHFGKLDKNCPSYEHLNSGHFCEFQLGWWRHWHNTNSSIRRFVLKIATLLIEFMRFIYDEIFGFFLKQKIFHLSTKTLTHLAHGLILSGLNSRTGQLYLILKLLVTEFCKPRIMQTN